MKASVWENGGMYVKKQQVEDTLSFGGLFIFDELVGLSLSFFLFCLSFLLSISQIPFTALNFSVYFSASLSPVHGGKGVRFTHSEDVYPEKGTFTWGPVPLMTKNQSVIHLNQIMHLPFQRANRMPHDHPYVPTERALHVWVPGKNMLYVHIHWSEMYLDATASKKAQDEVCFEWQWMRNAHTSGVWGAHVCTADDEPRVSMSKRVRDCDETFFLSTESHCRMEMWH